MAVISKSTDTIVRKRNRRAAGCVTCRIRRVKCDEGRPSCHRCTNTGRKCDGYPAPKEPAPIAYLIMAQTSSECEYIARTAFQYFREVCAPALSNYGSGHFWSRLVLQACHHDESIKHLIIAASCLGAQDYPLLQSTSSKGCPLYLSHYGRALKLLSRATSPDPAVVLMACLLLVLCNELQRKPDAAVQHILAGKNILASYTAQQQIQTSAAIAEIAPIFLQLERHTASFHGSDMTTSLPATLSDSESPSTPGSVAQVTDPGGQVDLSAPVTFTDINDAAISLQAIASACIATPRLEEPPPATVFHTVPVLTASLNSWLEHFATFEASHTEETSPFLTANHQILRMYHTILHILSRCVPYFAETGFDACTGTMERLILTSIQLVQLTPARLIPIMFFVATQCRNASIRRRAVEMLRQCGPEGRMLARIALKVVQIEERGVEEPITCADIPESKRVKVTDVQHDSLGDGYILLFRRYPYGQDTPIEYCSVSKQSMTSMDDVPSCTSLPLLLQAVLNFDFMLFWNPPDPSRSTFALPNIIAA
ncbi:hypothetical protein, variant [Exophiala sideris]|uniref:Zn(2)-C6 fungal-type domain-containing protein n=1 Tax=Exophiala sideris TaxID=1016849 RepID=A0A0D1Y7M3_9EURO|nr:hypothetical protein, variant [Exophiala sideris]